MRFNVGDVVRICDDDLLRGGEYAKVQAVLDSCYPTIREYVVEFATPPERFRNEDRFLFCLYREEQLVGQEGQRYES